MKKLLVLLLTVFVLQGCTSQSQPSAPQPDPQQPPVTAQPQTPEPAQPQTPEPASYSNDIFKDVTVTKKGEDTFEVKGKAQVFEAVAHYVVEDGHNELTEGSVQTSAGAPAWGDFTFTLKVKKAEPNTKLMLVL